MSEITPRERMLSMAEAVNAQSWLTRIGRACSLTFVLQIGDDEFHVTVEEGRIIYVKHGAFLLRSYVFAIRGAETAWAEFWRALPSRGFQDLFAMTTYGHVRVDGNLAPLRQNLPYIKGVLAALRDQKATNL